MEFFSGHKTLLTRMQNGEFLVSIQIDPPDAGSTAEFRAALHDLDRAGAKLIDINSSRRVSHDSIQLAVMLAQRGFEAIPHVTTRDSSINGLLNQVLAAYEWGSVRNFLVITGDPYEAAQAVIPSRGVFQTDAAGAIKAFDKHLRKHPQRKLPVTFAAAVNQNERDLAKEGKQICEKESAGADFFMSQPVFDRVQAQHLFDFYGQHSERPLLVGVWPFAKFKTVEAIAAGRIVGVELPDGLHHEAAMSSDSDDELLGWSIKRTFSLIEFLRESGRARGVYIVAPSRNPLLLIGLIAMLRERKIM